MKTPFILSFLVILVALTQIGCSTTSHSVDKDYTFIEHPDEGLIAYSLRYDLKCDAPPIGSHSYIDFGKGKERRRVILHNPFVPHDLDNPPGYIYLHSAKAGKHTLTSLEVNLGGTRYYLTPAKTVSYVASKQKIKYVGELTVTISSCDVKVVDDMGIRTADVDFKVKNEWKRDGKVLKERFDKIFTGKIYIGLMK